MAAAICLGQEVLAQNRTWPGSLTMPLGEIVPPGLKNVPLSATVPVPKAPDPLEQGSSWTLGSKCIAAGGQCVMPAMAALAALDRNLCNLCRPRHILST